MQVLTDTYVGSHGFVAAEVDELFMVSGGSSNPAGQAAGTSAVVVGLLTVAKGVITRDPVSVVSGVVTTVGGCITVYNSSK